MQEKRFLDEFSPFCPECALGFLHKENRHRVSLTCLHQGKGFHPLIECTEPARKKHYCIGFLKKGDFSIKEVFIGYTPWIPFNNRVGLLLEGESNIHPEGVFRSCSFMDRLHDAGTTPRDNHIP